MDERRARRPWKVKDGTKHGRRFRCRQGSKHHFACTPASVNLGKKAIEPGAGLITAIRQHEGDAWGWHAPDEEEEQFEACIIAPMDILDDHEQGALHGQAGQERPHLLKDATLLLLR